MYVDKRLSGVQAVQTLSRLNRRYAGKDRTFVLDFVNDREEILESFQVYYEDCTVEESIDPQRLYELKSELDQARIYQPSEVDLFAQIFFKPLTEQSYGDNAKLNAALDPAVDRFVAQEGDAAEEFRDRLQAFCNLYGFMAQIVPFSDVGLEKLYAFGKMLLRKLPRKAEASLAVEVREDVALYYYRMQKVSEGDLELISNPDDPPGISGPGETGTGKGHDELEKLSKLIQVINDRFGTDFDAQDLIDGVTEQLVADEAIQKAAAVNDKENFYYVLEPALDGALLDRHAKHGTFIDRVFEDEELLRFFRRRMLDEVYGRLREPTESASGEAS